MARLSGVDIPNQKRIEVALTYIYGIGLTSAKKILAATGINPDTRARSKLLPRYPSQKRSAGTRTAHQDQRENPQGTCEDYRK